MATAVLVLLWLLIILSLLPLWQTNEWWVRLWDFPRIQIAGLLLASLVALFFVTSRRRAFQWGSMAAGTAALVWQASHFGAYMPLMPKQVASVADCGEGRSLSLLNVNVLQDNRRFAELLDLVARVDPDVLLLLETDAAWAEAVAPLDGRYPHRISEPLPNTYGIMLFSKLPMEARILHRAQPDIPSVEARLRLPGGQSIMFHGVHPEPPLPGDDSGERDAELVMVGRDLREQGRAALVMGDLNDVAWSRTSRLFRQLAGVGDPRRGRGFYPTYHAKYPLVRWPLDHLFATPHFRLMAIDRHGDIGSDHFPIFYRTCLAEDASVRKLPANAPAEVEEQASEEVEEGRREKAAEDRGDE